MIVLKSHKEIMKSMVDQVLSPTPIHDDINPMDAVLFAIDGIMRELMIVKLTHTLQKLDLT